MQGGSIGYNIRSKFYTLNYLKSKLERIPVINNFPFLTFINLHIWKNKLYLHQ